MGTLFGFILAVAFFFAFAWIARRLLGVQRLSATKTMISAAVSTDPATWSPTARSDPPTTSRRRFSISIDRVKASRAFSGSPAAISRHAPALGEHANEVLSELGLDEAELADLRAKGVVG